MIYLMKLKELADNSETIFGEMTQEAAKGGLKKMLDKTLKKIFQRFIRDRKAFIN